MEQGQEIHTGLVPRASCYQGKTQSAHDKDEDGQTSRQTNKNLQGALLGNSQ